MKRPNWDHYFMIIADAVSLRMSCDRARIGAVLVSSDHRILATGYGGAPSGMPSCDEVGHDLVEINGRQSCVRTVHAEKNALLYAAKHGVAVAGSTLYTTASTCRDCALACIQAGITRIVYAGTYVGARGGGETVFEMLESMGVKVHKLPLDEALRHWTPAKSTSSVQQDQVTLRGDDYSNLRAIRGYLQHQANVNVPEWTATINRLLGNSPGLIGLAFAEDTRAAQEIRDALGRNVSLRDLARLDHVGYAAATSKTCRGGCSRGGDGPACGKPGCQG